jgi:hypothetical protein
MENIDHDTLIRVDENVKILLQRWERSEIRLSTIENKIVIEEICSGSMLERLKTDEIEIEKLRAQSIVHNWINSIGVVAVGVMEALFKVHL